MLPSCQVNMRAFCFSSFRYLPCNYKAMGKAQPRFINILKYGKYVRRIKRTIKQN